MGKTYPNKIKLSDAPSRARRIARKGNILFSTVRPNLKNFAKVERDYIIASTGFSVLEEKEININFLLSFLYSHYAEKQYFALTVGSNYPALNSEDVKGIKLPIPPLAEQEKIAD
ncbi:restriction endonuclease subunit S, partial [Ornithobacterium rhinotracheale]